MPDNRFSTQDIENQGADRTFNGFPMREIVGYDGSVLRRVKVDSAGNIIGSSLIGAEYDYVAVSYPTSSSDVYTFKMGGSGGTTVSTVTLTYTDSTKESLSTVSKS